MNDLEYRYTGYVNTYHIPTKTVVVDGETYTKNCAPVFEKIFIDELWNDKGELRPWYKIDLDWLEWFDKPVISYWECRYWSSSLSDQLSLYQRNRSENSYVRVCQELSAMNVFDHIGTLHAGRCDGIYDISTPDVPIRICRYGFNSEMVITMSFQRLLAFNLEKIVNHISHPGIEREVKDIISHYKLINGYLSDSDKVYILSNRIGRMEKDHYGRTIYNTNQKRKQK